MCILLAVNVHHACGNVGGKKRLSIRRRRSNQNNGIIHCGEIAVYGILCCATMTLIEEYCILYHMLFKM